MKRTVYLLLVAYSLPAISWAPTQTTTIKLPMSKAQVKAWITSAKSWTTKAEAILSLYSSSEWKLKPEYEEVNEVLVSSTKQYIETSLKLVKSLNVELSALSLDPYSLYWTITATENLSAVSESINSLGLQSSSSEWQLHPSVELSTLSHKHSTTANKMLSDFFPQRSAVLSWYDGKGRPPEPK